MNFHELIPLTAAITNLALTLFVMVRDTRSTLNRVYVLWGLSITVWNLGTFFMFRVNDPVMAKFWAKFLQFGVIFLPISLFHLCLLIAQISVPRFLRYLYAFHGLLALTNFTDFFVKGVKYVDYAYYTVGGSGFFFFTAVYSVLTMSTIVMLYRKQRRLPPLRRTRLKSLLWANGILILFGVNDILPILGFDRYPFTDARIFPYGSAAAIVYGIIVGYSVLQHHLLDIQITLSRVAAHIVRLIFLFLVGLSLLLVLTVLAPEQFTVFSFFSALSVLLVSALSASFFFPRLFGTGEDELERRILGDRFEYHDKIKGFTRSIPMYAEANLLLDDLHDLLVRTVQVGGYQIILLDEKTRAFSVFRRHPENPGTRRIELSYDSALFGLFKKHMLEFVSSQTAHAPPAATPEERQARHLLEELQSAFCFPFYSGNDPFGLLFVGEKRNGEPYTPHDLRLLTELVVSLSLVINQIRLKDQILIAQELELLGRMSRGMAHDLNNLLTPVWTYLQLSNAGLDGGDTRRELLPMATRNLLAIRAYVNEALFFSNNLAPNFTPCRLREVVHHALGLLEPEIHPKHLQVSVFAPEEILAEADEVLLQRALKNVLSNAVDASHDGGSIEIELMRLARTEAARHWIRLRVVDHGEGIRRENLQRVWQPYFTTKDSGDRKRGFGLGLAICRKIIHLHGGSLNITSEYKKGTIVQMDLPDRQPAAEAEPLAVAS